MVEHPGVAALTQIMSPDHGADEQVDWAVAETTWNVRFPTDYKAFMSVYGGGSINGEAGVLLSVPTEGIQGDPGDMAGETENARHGWEMEGGRAALDVDPAHILAWGITSGPDILCWLTEDSDPDRWPVLVHGRHTSPTFTVHPFGMVEFLRRLVHEDYDGWSSWPISIGGELWNCSPPTFVHWRVGQLRWKAGLDPATGEPDPYADMFPR
ncbi:SMI1/KNR4 family protein [Streptomyces mirabilis]|uniref:SMI1/KNR4 family protein n=1 Tax=Streptomyces mirabilis TaxID=68239 RepID=UPI0035D6BFFE